MATANEQSAVKSTGLERLRDTFAVSDATARSMRSNRSVDTVPERLLRKHLWKRGIRGYRKNVRMLPGAPDLVFGRRRKCIFVHGCFWHGCTACRKQWLPKTNRAYWKAKLDYNKKRDAVNEKRLRDLGYDVLIVWECEVRRDTDAIVAVIAAFLDQE